MSADQLIQTCAIVVPLLAGIFVDGIRTRTAQAVLTERVKNMGGQMEELERRQARHERDPAHARMRSQW
jgi:hypothetical protein